MVKKDGDQLKFHLGLFDRLFGNKTTMSFTNAKGEDVQRIVSEKWLAKMLEEKTMEIIDTVEAIVFDPLYENPITEEWKIDIDIPKDMVDQFFEPSTKKIYVIRTYVDGEPQEIITTQSKFLEFIEEFNDKINQDPQ